MKKKFTGILHAALFLSATGLLAGCQTAGTSSIKENATVIGTGNPYLPLWEHLPDGEPRVFEDPDNPGKYRAYIIGSHDLRFRE